MSCETINIAKGADLSVLITLKGQDGNVIDATIFDKIVVYVNHSNGTLISKYSKNTAVGYEDIDLTDAVNGILGVKLLTEHTNSSPEGKLLYEVHCQYTDAAIADDGVLDFVTTGNYLCNIIASKTGTLTLP